MIRNFIYLDEEKMYSLSSQLFEGVTEYVLNESLYEEENSETQKGPVGSGRILGDILKRSDRNSEKKFLNDYSYTLFEEKLLSDDKVIDISEGSVDFQALGNGRSFVKVKARAVFNDINSINLNIENFNKMGKALTHITNFQEITQMKEQLEKAQASTKDRNQRNKQKLQANSMVNLNKMAKEAGLQLDQGFLDDLAMVLAYGFQDQFEVQLECGESIFSANLNRTFLREEVELLIRKYSRKTEVDFTLFGIVTQCKGDEVEERTEGADPENMKMALMNMVSHIGYLESTFTGRLDNEVIVDPIALYTEL